MSLLVDRLNGVFRSSLSFTRCQLSGNAERIRARGALEGARQPRERLDRLAVLVPALHRAVVQAQRERGVRDRRWCRAPRSARGRCARWRSASALRLCLRRPCARARASASTLRAQHDHRIGRTRRSRPRRLSTAPCAPPDRRASCSVTRRLRERRRRFLRQQLAHHRVIGAQPLAHALEAVAEAQLLELRVDRHGGAELLLDARQRAVGELAEALRHSAWRARRRRAPACARSSTSRPWKPAPLSR